MRQVPAFQLRLKQKLPNS